MKTKIVLDKRPDVILSLTQKIKTPCGNLYLTLGYFEKENMKYLVEIFASTASLRGSNCGAALSQTCRLLSKNLRRGISRIDLADDISGQGCPLHSEEGLLTCPKIIERSLLNWKEEDTK